MIIKVNIRICNYKYFINEAALVLHDVMEYHSQDILLICRKVGNSVEDTILCSYLMGLDRDSLYIYIYLVYILICM